MQPIPTINRPRAELVEGLKDIGTAKLSSVIYRMGYQNVFMAGPARAHEPGRTVAGPALTLQFMPKRRDVYGDDEYGNPEAQLHRHVLYQTEPGDIVVVDARGCMTAGIFGEMMLAYFKGRGGAGMVVDGCIRDFPNVSKLEVPLWVRGFTPNFHTQTDLMPFAVNVPVACGGVLVLPGDIIVADDDGAIAVPAVAAEELLQKGSIWHEWEDYSRIRLLEGGDLRRYYPLAEDARGEFEAWKAAQAQSVSG
ncbi:MULTISPECIES: ribonuclease activity regulator RraA [unclassified Chelatococcus]|uniref:ribonuclease activity regulator RraA n=1 Tax=unclassified Chelatococcus TaxID=2638111 RepID=UPI001BCF8587|nr:MULTISPECIES: ribonuclease activity regulator RraA [unclassified Chelatococcus]CAH1656505.1 Regulator of RNase E activity RraA [Hyphomicrobiales bacterium]MBS7742444.1 ribonuclease activity regulator RraA [Chelatococcus sp. HY11]MBX3542438.1 ribonuclease activity regulator RraA [Chelatococcus sp.]MCO5075345.1 ribonuclease activity regulator RraA [Chelatococcus sp.]CAH1695862.1 Regulator of RNase E activity RraA [Hyphomicrobiales bacterium]